MELIYISNAFSKFQQLTKMKQSMPVKTNNDRLRENSSLSLTKKIRVRAGHKTVILCILVLQHAVLMCGSTVCNERKEIQHRSCNPEEMACSE